MKKIAIIIISVLIFNWILIAYSVTSGYNRGDLMLRFSERQVVTFLSALMLGLTSLITFVMYSLKKRLPEFKKRAKFWLFCSVGFLYLCMDEYFMMHEGMDGIVGSLFGKDIDYLNLDGLVLGFFGIIASGVCFYFRKEIFKHRELMLYLILGAVGLLGTVIFHSLEGINIVYEVIEESFKILGVSFLFAGFLATLLSFIKSFPASKR